MAVVPESRGTQFAPPSPSRFRKGHGFIYFLCPQLSFPIFDKSGRHLAAKQAPQLLVLYTSNWRMHRPLRKITRPHQEQGDGAPCPYNITCTPISHHSTIQHLHDSPDRAPLGYRSKPMLAPDFRFWCLQWLRLPSWWHLAMGH